MHSAWPPLSLNYAGIDLSRITLSQQGTHGSITVRLSDRPNGQWVAEFGNAMNRFQGLAFTAKASEDGTIALSNVPALNESGIAQTLRTVKRAIISTNEQYAQARTEAENKETAAQRKLEAFREMVEKASQVV